MSTNQRQILSELYVRKTKRKCKRSSNTVDKSSSQSSSVSEDRNALEKLKDEASVNHSPQTNGSSNETSSATSQEDLETDSSNGGKVVTSSDDSKNGSSPKEKQDSPSVAGPSGSTTRISGEGTQTGGSGGVGGGPAGSGSGGGGGGMGNRKPGGERRLSKLPACNLPNNMQPTFYIGGGNGTALVETPLLALGWKRITDKYDEKYRLKWVECKTKINYAAFKEGEQLVNHIPNCKLLTNKLGLLSSLQEYERVTFMTKGRLPRMKMCDFVPETYKLDERNDREKFLNEYKDGEVWICKPTGMNQGKGIFLLRSRAEINQLLVERDAKNQTKTGSRPPMMRIVQRYIHNPLLLEGRKFDIRAYMLIASTIPYLLLYHKGYVRLSVMQYDNDDTNLTTHLTNQYIQKKDPNYKDLKEDSAWSMDKFNDYINENFAGTVETDWAYGHLTKQMQRIILHCFNAVKHKLHSKIGYFDLYGMDFMVDTDFKVWLIEINVNPALHINCEALKEVIPDVVEEALHLSIECFDKSRKSQPLMPLNSLQGFNVLYCGTSPNTVAARQTRSVSPAKDGTEKVRSSGTSPSARRASPPRNLPLPRVTLSTQFNNSNMTNTAGNQTTSNNSQASTAKRVSINSTLPTINIGNTVISKPSKTVGGNSNSVAASQQLQVNQKQPLQQQQQPPQRQPSPYQQTTTIPLTSSTSIEGQHKLRMTHSETGRRRSRDHSHRGN